MIDEENYNNLKMLIGKTITDVNMFEAGIDRTDIKFLTTDGDILSIIIEGDDFVFIDIKHYASWE